MLPKRLKSEDDDLLYYHADLVNLVTEARRLHGELSRRDLTTTDTDYQALGERLCRSDSTRVKDIPQAIVSDINKMKACLAKLELRRRLPYLVILLVAYLVFFLFLNIDAIPVFITALSAITVLILSVLPQVIDIMRRG